MPAGEAAAAAARTGARTALVTQRRETIGLMSCNPAIGGWARGISCARSMLGRVDGPGRRRGRHSVPGAEPRQGASGARPARPRRTASFTARRCSGRSKPSKGSKSSRPRPSIRDRERGNRGVDLADGRRLACPSAVLTTGTFSMALIHCGPIPAPRARWRCASIALARTLHRLASALGRLKTGTPPRLDGRTNRF